MMMMMGGHHNEFDDSDSQDKIDTGTPLTKMMISEYCVLTSAGLLVPLIGLGSSSVAPGDPGVTSGSLSSPAVFTVSATTSLLFSAAELILCVGVCVCFNLAPATIYKLLL